MEIMKIVEGIIAALTLLGLIEFRIKNIVKHYLSELRPNGGSSMKDQINRLEIKVETLLEVLKKD